MITASQTTTIVLLHGNGYSFMDIAGMVFKAKTTANKQKVWRVVNRGAAVEVQGAETTSSKLLREKRYENNEMPAQLAFDL